MVKKLLDIMGLKSALPFHVRERDTERDRERQRETERQRERQRERFGFFVYHQCHTLVKKVGLKAHSFGYNPTLKIFDH